MNGGGSNSQLQVAAVLLMLTAGLLRVLYIFPHEIIMHQNPPQRPQSSSSKLSPSPTSSVSPSEKQHVLKKGDISTMRWDDYLAETTRKNNSNIFDCERLNSICSYFVPREFFRQGRPGHQYKSETLFQEFSGGGIFHFNWTYSQNRVDSNSSCADAIRQYMHLPTEITYLHVHKSGGTSILEAMDGLEQKMAPLKLPSHGPCITHAARMPLSCMERYKQLQKKARGAAEKAKVKLDPNCDNLDSVRQATSMARRIHQSQKTFGTQRNVLFTMMRDPISRFVSGVGQALKGNRGSLRDRCLHDTPIETLRCMLDVIKVEGTATDIHLVPQANLMASKNFLGPPGVDIKVSIFQMNHIPYITSFLTQENVHARDRTSAAYNKYDTLRNMSTADLTPDMVEDLCHLYAVDVTLMVYLGFRVPSCNVTTLGTSTLR